MLCAYLRSGAAFFSSSTLFLADYFSLPDFGFFGSSGSSALLARIGSAADLNLFRRLIFLVKCEIEQLAGGFPPKRLRHGDCCLIARDLVVLSSKSGANDSGIE